LYKTALPLDIPYPCVFLSTFPLLTQNASYYTESTKKTRKNGTMKIRLNRYFPWRSLQHLACRSITATSVCFTWLCSYTRWLTFAVRIAHYIRGLTTLHCLHPLSHRLLYDERLLSAMSRSRLKECWRFATTCWKCSYSSCLEDVFFASNLGKCHVVIKRNSTPVFCWNCRSTFWDKLIFSSATQTLDSPV